MSSPPPRDPGDLVDTTSEGVFGRSLPTPSQVGPYRLLRRVGEGGMGEVWLAEQQQPVRRQVALKVIKAGHGHRAR